jgi:DNA-binding response OmpR family regulator
LIGGLLFLYRRLILAEIASTIDRDCKGSGLRYFFEDFSLDTERRELCRGLELVPIAPKGFDLLGYLIGNRERVVSKDDLISAIWDGGSSRMWL